jgi:hypothetical protein
MAKTVSPSLHSPHTPRLEDVAKFYSDTQKSLYYYYSNGSLGNLDPKFVGYSPEELSQERSGHLRTLDEMCAFSVLAALEAEFRIDFKLRCVRRSKDDLSRHFRGIQKKLGSRIPSLEEDILEAWKSHVPGSKAFISQFKAALNYRHWFAHGRYYRPKLGMNYDFMTVYILAQSINQGVKLLE